MTGSQIEITCTPVLTYGRRVFFAATVMSDGFRLGHYVGESYEDAILVAGKLAEHMSLPVVDLIGCEMPA